MRARSAIRAVFTSIGAGLLILGPAQAAVAGPPSSADLSVTISDSPDPVAEGDEITYTISVSNAGPATPSNVTVGDTVQGGASYVRGSASQGSCTVGSGGASASCSLGSLSKGASATVTFVFRAAASDVTSTADVSGSLSDNKMANNQASTTTTVHANEEPGGEPGEETLATCTSVAPHWCSAGLNTTFRLPDETVVRVTLDPAPGFTGYLFAYFDYPAAFPDSYRVYGAAARYKVGELVSGTEEAFVTLSSGTWSLRADTRDTPIITVGGGSGSSEPFCTPAYSWFLRPICLPGPPVGPPGPKTVALPATGAYTVTASA